MAFQLFEANKKHADKAAALEAANDQLERFFAVNLDLLCIADMQGRFVKVNKAWEEILGHSTAELEGRSFMEFVHPDDVDATIEAVAKLDAHEDVVSFVNRYQCRDGTYRFIEWRSHPSGRHIYAAARDVTDWKRLEEERDLATQEYETIFDSTQDAMFLIEVTDDEFRFIRSNRTHQQTTGLPLEAIRGRTPSQVVGEEEGRAVEENYRRCVAERRPISYEETLTFPGGRRTWQTTLTPVSRNGRVGQIVGSAQDISERKRAEESVQSLLADKELLLREVHHRIKNNMHTMMSLLSLEAQTLREPGAAAALNEARSRMQSMELLYEKLYQLKSYREMSIAEYVPQLVGEIVDVLPTSTKVQVEIEAEPVVLETRQLQALGIIITELITNAVKHAFTGREKGSIFVSAHRRDGRVTVIVQDDGRGMPLFTENTEERGFGLTLVEALAEQLRGTITMKSVNGIRFELEFPA